MFVNVWDSRRENASPSTQASGAFIGSEHRGILPNRLKTAVNRLRHVLAALLLRTCHAVEAAIVTSFT
jgi:hypothetical protein